MVAKSDAAADAYAEHLPKAGHDESLVVSSDAAARFQAHQHDMTIMEALRENWKPLAWCSYMVFVCIMYGYDALAGSVVISISQFRKDFGYPYGGDYVVSAAWQLGFQAAFFVGIILGGIVVGPVVTRIGRKYTIAGAYVVNIGGVFLQFFSTTPAHFFGGKLLTGFPLGSFATIAPTYASEMSPLIVRGAITAGMNLAIVLGNTIGYGVMREASFYTGKLTYRILFAVQWGFVGTALLILPFLPESPYWYISHNREEEARAVLARLFDSSYDMDGRVAEIKAALQQEDETRKTQGTFRDCFSRPHWKRTVVAMMAFVIQNFSGMGWVIGYMSYFMQLAGMSSAKSFDMTVVISGVMVVGNMCSWYFVERLGRRGTMLWGSTLLLVCLLAIAIIAVTSSSQSALTGQVILMGIWAFSYQGTVGAVAWPIASENATSWLRTPTQALCTIANALTASIWGLSLPYAVNPDRGNLQGKIGFIYAALLVLSIIFTFFFIPETKGRTYSEIDELWKSGVPPRKWAGHKLVHVGNSKEEDVDAPQQGQGPQT